jgi:hypothetical protein
MYFRFWGVRRVESACSHFLGEQSKANQANQAVFVGWGPILKEISAFPGYNSRL